MQYAMITELGLNKINEANPNGQYIEIGYYVPVYDYRIDPTIFPVDTTIIPTEISSCTSSSDKYPQGEVIWNASETSTYSLSPDKKYLIRTGEETVTPNGMYNEITNFKHREIFNINRFNEEPISNYYTANEVLSPGNSGTMWQLSVAGYDGLVAITTGADYLPSDIENPDVNKLYKGVTYQQVISSEDESRANFKVTIRADKGTIRFNKLGLYGVKRTADGVLSGEPFLFAQVIFSEPQVLYSKSIDGKVSEITLDFQIESKTLSAGIFENVFYSTSGDYWVRTTNQNDGTYGLLYDGSVYITNRLGVDETGGIITGTVGAKLLVGTCEYINNQDSNIEKDMPQLALQYVINEGIDTQHIHTTFKVVSGGDCEIDMGGACLYDRVYKYSLIPRIDGEYGLGIEENKWSHICLKNRFELFNDGKKDDIYESIYIDFDSINKRANFYNTDIYCGPYYDVGSTETVTKRNNSNYFNGNISSYRTDIGLPENIQHIGTDLLIRGLNDIALVTLHKDYSDTFTAEEIVTLMWNTVSDSEDTIISYLGDEKDILIMAGRNIHTYGSIVPMVTDRNNLGSKDKIFKNIYINTIIGKDENSLQNTINVKGNLIPLPPVGELFPSIGSTKSKWSEIHCKSLGAQSAPILRGFITRLDCEEINLSDSSKIEFDNGILIESTTMKNITQIGTRKIPVGTLYVDNLIVTNEYTDYKYSDESVEITNIKYGTDFKKAIHSLKFYDLTMRYNSLSDSGIITITIKEDKHIATSSDKWSPREGQANNKHILTLLDNTELKELNIKDGGNIEFVTKFMTLRQSVHFGSSNGTRTFQAYINKDGKLYGNYKTIDRFKYFLSDNAVIAFEDIELQLRFSGKPGDKWKKQ